MVIPTRPQLGKTTVHPRLGVSRLGLGRPLVGLCAVLGLLAPATSSQAHLDRGHGLSLGYQLKGATIRVAHRLPWDELRRRLPEVGPEPETALDDEASSALRQRVIDALSGPWGIEADGTPLPPRLEGLDLHPAHALTGTVSLGAQLVVMGRFVFPPSATVLVFRWPEDGVEAHLDTPDGGITLRFEGGRAVYEPTGAVPAYSFWLFALAACILMAAVAGRLLRGRSRAQ